MLFIPDTIVITDIKIDARPYIVMSDFLTLQSFQLLNLSYK